MHRIVALCAVSISVTTHVLAGQSTILQDSIMTIVDGDTIPGFGAVGGVTVDQMGYVYVANFRNEVWRYAPGGPIELYAKGMYGASGNAVGPRGELYQANYYGNSISRILRDGTVEVYADSGLSGPVGITVGPAAELHVVNCTGGSVARIDRDRSVTQIAGGPLFACPNGITRDDRGDLYVVNMGNTQIIRITPDGQTSVFADLPGAGGNAHIAFGRGGLYVTKIRGHQVFRVERDGSSRVVAGTGQQGQTSGPATAALLSQPNGIVMAPNGKALWINELVSGAGVAGGPAHAVLRQIQLITLTDVILAAAPGPASVAEAYRRYRARFPKDDTSTEAVSLGYQLLTPQRAADALIVFEMNAADYPSHIGSQYQLGEAYRFTSQLERAAAQYTKVLSLEPEHALARARLESLGQQ